MLDRNGKSEISAIKSKYFSSNTSCLYRNSTQEDVLEAFDALKVAKDWNMPDGYAVLNDKTYIFEHFEFDAYRRTKKGSSFKKEDTEIQSRFIKKNNINPDINHITTVSSAVPCIQDYEKNVLDLFAKHLAQVTTYTANIRNLLPEMRKIKIFFLIEDTTILGSCLKNRQPFILPHCTTFLDAFERQNEVKGIICFSLGAYDNPIICYMDKESVPIWRTEAIPSGEAELIPWSTFSTHHIIKIPMQ